MSKRFITNFRSNIYLHSFVIYSFAFPEIIFYLICACRKSDHSPSSNSWSNIIVVHVDRKGSDRGRNSSGLGSEKNLSMPDSNKSSNRSSKSQNEALAKNQPQQRRNYVDKRIFLNPGDSLIVSGSSFGRQMKQPND